MVGAKLLRADGRKAPPCVFLFPARFFSCQPRFFVRQRPRSAALVLALPCSPRFFCCGTVFLLLCSRVVGSPLLPFRVYFFSLAAAKGFVLLKKLCPPACAPRRYRARGATVFGFSLGRFPACCTLFRSQKPCIPGRMPSFRAGVRAFPLAGAALLSL